MMILGIPFDFVLFVLTLAGVALFHRHTLAVAVTGLCVIVAYKLVITGFATGPGIGGLVAHLGHEWVVLANLFGLMVGFVLLLLVSCPAAWPTSPLQSSVAPWLRRCSAARSTLATWLLSWRHPMPAAPAAW